MVNPRRSETDLGIKSSIFFNPIKSPIFKVHLYTELDLLRQVVWKVKVVYEILLLDILAHWE